MYVIADERDVITLRSNFRKDDVFLYPIRTTPERRRQMLVEMLQRANRLAEHPEFYNTLTNTCTTNIVRHVNTISAGRVPWSYKVLLPACSDELAYDLGLIETTLSLGEARRRFRSTIAQRASSTIPTSHGESGRWTDRMPTDYRRATDFLRQALGSRSAGDLERLRPRTGAMPPKVPGASAVTTEAIDERWALNAMPKAARGELADARTIEQRDACARSIENFIGTVKVPVGLAGPLRVNGLHAHGDYYVPLATTEAALVASYSRGAQVVSSRVAAPRCSSMKASAARPACVRHARRGGAFRRLGRIDGRPVQVRRRRHDPVWPVARYGARSRGQSRLPGVRLHDG